MFEHAKDAHNILDVGEHETELTNNVENLHLKRMQRYARVDIYASFVVDQRKRVHNLQEQRKDEMIRLLRNSSEIEGKKDGIGRGS